MRFVFFATLAALLPSSGIACSAIKDDAGRLACYDKHAGLQMIRCTDAGGAAVCEITSPKVDSLVSCTAFDASNNALARGMGTGGSGVLYNEVKARDIDHLDCEEMQ